MCSAGRENAPMRIGFIGTGNMASALAASVAGGDPGIGITGFDVSPEQLKRFRTRVPGAAAAADNREVVATSNLVFLAVKPQAVKPVLEEISGTDALIVSILAGVRLAALEAALPRARLVRVMPNAPALVGAMAAAYSGGTRAGDDDLELVGAVLGHAGIAMRLPEELLDAVTGVSGSGPAFVARFIEAFTDAAIAAGIPRPAAVQLVLATFCGTARLLEEKQLAPEELVAMVSSPGGTTVAGRAVLESSDLASVIRQTVSTTIARSRELGDEGAR